MSVRIEVILGGSLIMESVREHVSLTFLVVQQDGSSYGKAWRARPTTASPHSALTSANEQR